MEGGSKHVWNRLFGSCSFQTTGSTTDTTNDLASFGVRMTFADGGGSAAAGPGSAWWMNVVGIAHFPFMPVNAPNSFAVDDHAYVVYSSQTAFTLYRAHNLKGDKFRHQHQDCGFLNRTVGIAIHIPTGSISAFVDSKPLQFSDSPLALPGLVYSGISDVGEYYPFAAVSAERVRVTLYSQWRPPESYFDALPKYVEAVKSGAFQPLRPPLTQKKLPAESGLFD